MRSSNDMSDWIDELIFFDELSEDGRTRLDGLLERDEEGTASAAFEEWKRLRSGIREELGSEVLDRRDLIHFAIWRSGNASVLTKAEMADVKAMLPHYEEAVSRSSAIQSIVDRIADEQEDFVQTWRLHAGDQSASQIGSTVERIRQRRSNDQARAVFWRAAAVVAVMATTIALYVGAGIQSRTVYVTSAPNEVKSVVLDDNSLVRLVNGAELEYLRGTDDEPFDRTVSIKGRAYLQITPGDTRFVVETPSAVTTVWGTTFGLDSDDSFTEVVLAEGRVTVTSRRDSRNPVLLEPGEMTRVVGSRAPTTPVRVNLTDALSYTKLFVFRNETTLMIATKLTEHFGVPITVDPALGGETVTGTFERDWSLGYILEAVARTLDGRVEGSEEMGYSVVPLEGRSS